MSGNVEAVVSYLVIITVGALLFWYEPRFFTFYAFIVTVGLIFHFTGRLWKLIVVSHASTNTKLLVLAKKAGVSDSDYGAVMAEMRRKQPGAYKVFESAVRDLGPFA